MTLAGPGKDLKSAPPSPPRVNSLPGLASWATVRETADRLSYEQAVAVAESILEDLKSGKIQRPYAPGVRMSLETAGARIAQEAGA